MNPPRVLDSRSSLPDEPAQGVGQQIVEIVEAPAEDELQVLRGQRQDEAGHHGPDAGVGAEPAEHVGQQIPHGHEEHDVEVHLGDVLGPDDLHMGEPLRQPLREHGLQDVHQAPIGLHRVIEVLEGGHMDLVGFGGGPGEERDHEEGRHVQQKHRVQHQLPKPQQGVGVGVGAETVLQVQTELPADPPVDIGQQHDEHRHGGGDGQQGDGMVHIDRHGYSIREKRPVDNTVPYGKTPRRAGRWQGGQGRVMRAR